MAICPASQSHQSAPSKLQSAIRLSVFVCAHNEAADLGACLERLRFADEVVVLLDRSTDGSAAIACALGDRVIEGVFPLEGPRRAAAQAACSGEWVLEVDADEHIPPALAREIRARLDRGEPADWYLVPVDNYVGGRPICSPTQAQVQDTGKKWSQAAATPTLGGVREGSGHRRLRAVRATTFWPYRFRPFSAIRVGSVPV